MKKKILIGTSGWSYNHWRENFYPKNMKTTDWLNFYAHQFSTVEVNSTFYHSPLQTTLKNWHDKVPSDFFFSIKANRYITHRKKLHDCQESVDYFFKNIHPLKEKIGPILFQLPPSFKINEERLTVFLSWLPDQYLYTFEFRHISWFVTSIYDLLSKHKIALCVTDLNGHLTPEELTSNFTYIRLHGPESAYQGSYGPKDLSNWQRKIAKWNESVSVYCYFDNDEKGFAVQDAIYLQKLF